MSSTEQYRAAWVEIDLEAVEANVAELTRLAYPAKMLAVVKADARDRVHGRRAGRSAAEMLRRCGGCALSH